MPSSGHRRDTADGVRSTIRRLRRVGYTLVRDEQRFIHQRFFNHDQLYKYYDFVTAHNNCPDCGHDLASHDKAGRCHTAADNITATCPCPCGWRKS